MAQPPYAGKKLFLTQTDLANYPFLPEAAKYIERLDLRITELDREYEILDRAEQRIRKAIESASFQKGKDKIKDETEIPSFPIAVMMVAYGNDPSLKKRFALAESNRASALLKEEDEQKLIFVAELFNWKIKAAQTDTKNLKATNLYAIDFVSYLRNTKIFHESKWKLVNRSMQRGEVYVTKEEVARLLQEEVKSYIEKKLDLKIDFVLSKAVADRVEKLKQLYFSLKGKIQDEEMPTETIVDAFPPCINRLYNAALTKQHLSHIERFTLTSFLLNSGMTVENVIECFRPTSDFSEKMTRYQVEHIAGVRGSRAKYVPPKCSTLRTHQICLGGDEICEKVGRPLTYYRRKIGIINSKTPQPVT